VIRITRRLVEFPPMTATSMPVPDGVPRRLAIVAAATALILATGGCVVGPNYERPNVDLPDRFVEDGDVPEPGTAISDEELLRWWERFDDPLLTAFIAEAEQGNLDLKQAIAAIEQYRASFGVANSKLYPSLDADAGYSYVQLNEALLGGNALPSAFNAWSYGLNLASWEIDLFGKIRRSIEFAQGEYQATVEEWRNTLVTLRSEVANAYIAVRVLQARRKILTDSISLLSKQLEIVKARIAARTVTGLDLAEAEASLAIIESELPLLDAEIAARLSGLSVLLGQYPGEVAKRMAEAKPVPQPEVTLGLGVPAELLLRRPDVRASERRMAAEVARIGVAVAGFYPEISLSGNVSIFATDFSGLFDLSNLTYRVGPMINWNFFNAGRTQAQVQWQEAVAKQAEIQYRSTVLEAVSEVETAASNVGYARTTLERLDSAVVDGLRGVGLAERQYTAGTIDLSRLIEYQRMVLELRNSQAQAEGFYAQNIVELYRSLGGGWEPDPLPKPADEAYPQSDPDGEGPSESTSPSSSSPESPAATAVAAAEPAS
jgi:outer membrane protein, multidrug efflux system